VLPDSFLEQLKDKSREEAEELSVEFSMKIAHRIKDFCDGFYIMTPLNRIDLVCRLMERISSEIQ
jgi:homocysteine S-methyltransferase